MIGPLAAAFVASYFNWASPLSVWIAHTMAWIFSDLALLVVVTAALETTPRTWPQMLAHGAKLGAAWVVRPFFWLVVYVRAMTGRNVIAWYVVTSLRDIFARRNAIYLLMLRELN